MEELKMKKWRYWVFLMLMLMLRRSEGYNCPTIKDCMCQASGSDFEIFCHIDGTRITFRFLPLKLFVIECEGVGTFDYSKIPWINLGRTTVDNFSLKGCPLPDTSLGEVITRLGITKAVSVSIHGNSNSSRSLEKMHFKGLAELGTTRLSLTNNGFTSLPKNLLEDMKNLTWLNLRSNNVRLDSGFFTPLNKLEILELSDNHLNGIPDGMLSNLTSLKSLLLWHNNIHVLKKGVFEGLGELKNLDLSGNMLRELPEEIFLHLENLISLYLYSNNFTSLPNNLLAHNKKLEEFRLFNNNVNMSKLPEYLLSDQDNLRIVGLYKVGLETIPENVFSNSTNIRNISLAYNYIEHLPAVLFQDQVKLVNLELNENRIKQLPPTIFASQESLEYLDISNNQIVNIESELFQFLANLKYLIMNNNRLKQLDYYVFGLSTSIVHIDMSYNQLKFHDEPIGSEDEQTIEYQATVELVSPFSKIVNLKHLNLSHNLITLISTDWRINHVHMENLDLTYNQITEIKYPDVVFLSDQINVDLSHNNITSIDFNGAEIIASFGKEQPDARNSMSAPPHNVKVLIKDNPIHCDCILMRYIQYLRDELDPQIRATVDLDPGDMTCASSSTDLKGKPIKNLRPEELLCPFETPPTKNPPECPDGCSCFVRTFDLALIISCTDGIVKRIPKLPYSQHMKYTELHLENNGFSELQPRGIISEHVTKLYLRGNNLTHLADGDIPSNIEVLNLSHNKLQNVNSSIANMILNGTRLQEIWLSHNPIACDCSNNVFLALIQKNRVKVKDYDLLQCPNGEMIKYLAVGNLCGTTPAVIAASVLIALAGLIAGLMAAAYYKYNQEVKVYLFAKGLCLWWVTEEELDRDKLYDAFVSFSYKDEEFVVNKLISPLEKGSTPFKLCVHFRDWVAGEIIPEQIAKSVQDSRRTIVILSPNFLDSVWGRMEFRAAHSQALKEGRARVIVIIYGDIGATENLDPELQSYLSTNTYVKWGDPWFWDKLRYALPHPTHRGKRNVTSHGSISKKKGFDDRLELIHPASPTTPPGLNTPPAHQANLLLNQVNGAPNGITKFPALNGHVNGAITMNGLKVNVNAKHSEV